jgi:hypothetical protein
MTTIGSALLSADLSHKPASPYGKNADGELLSNGRYSAAKVIGVLFIVGCMGFAWAQPLTPPTTVTLPPSSIEGPTDAGVNAHTYLQILGTSKNFAAAPQETGPFTLLQDRKRRVNIDGPSWLCLADKSRRVGGLFTLCLY